MNQCVVPCWDLDETIHTTYPTLALHQVTRPAATTGTGTIPVVPMPDFAVAELTWKNGHISSHGLTKPIPKYPAPATTAAVSGWNKHDDNTGDAETLEAVVSEATRSHILPPPSPTAAHTVAWLVGPGRGSVDGHVQRTRDEADVGAGSGRRKRARVVGEDGLVCPSQGSAAPGRGESRLLALDAGGGGGGGDDFCVFTATTNNSTSLSAPGDWEEYKGSPDTENTSFGGGANDSLCHSRRSQRDGVCEGENVVKGEAVRSSISTKRSRAAAVHNESERKRRDRINQKMKILQKLVPNSSKIDKASMLDEVIDYLKQLQAQVQVMNRMNSMMMPMAMPQLQMSMMANMAQMAQMAQMSMGMGGMNMMNMTSLAQPGYNGLTPPLMLHPQTFVPLATPQWDGSTDKMQQPSGSVGPDPFAAFLASQASAQGAQQPPSLDAYNRMLSAYQQLYQQNQPSNSKP